MKKILQLLLSLYFITKMKKKILIIIGSLDLGGTEKQLYSKIKSLKDSFDFYLLIFHKKGFLYKDFENLNIKIFNFSNHIEIKIFKVIKTFFKIISCIKIINPDFVHFYLPHSYILGGLSSFLFKNVKFIMSRRSMNNYQKKFFFIKFFESKILHRKMKLIVANSEFIKNQLINEEGVEKKRIKVIYNFINPIKLKKRKSKFINILFIANLIPYKNHEMIVRASTLLSKKYKFKVHLIGEGNKFYKKYLKCFYSLL